LKTELTIVGCDPDIEKPVANFVKIMGFVSKSSALGKKQIDELIAGSHFLILPTRADASPIVLCEANSFGVPCLTTDVGGIPSIIRDDVNGRMFTLADGPDSYCEYIIDSMSNYSRYRCMALRSFNEYKTRLNWESAGRVVKNLLEEYCA
jgi:glycosyltransferase involved in cell wall biosynthesis